MSRPGTMIHDPIAANLGIEPDDFDCAPFAQEGDLGKAPCATMA